MEPAHAERVEDAARAPAIVECRGDRAAIAGEDALQRGGAGRRIDRVLDRRHPRGLRARGTAQDRGAPGQRLAAAIATSLDRDRGELEWLARDDGWCARIEQAARRAEPAGDDDPLAGED